MTEAMSPLHPENFIGGEYVEACTSRRADLIDPSADETFGDAPASGQVLDRQRYTLARVTTDALACVAVLTPPPARCRTAARGRERRRP
jgi:hypothetical protein